LDDAASDEDATSAEEAPSGSGVATAEEELVCIVEYDYLDEADLARGLLEAAEINASLESEPGVVRLMVPAGFAEQALRMLAAPLSDEELAAQAEAAGFADEEEDAEAEPDEDPEP
jgi:6-phosphogluconate dehydrogenase (decarboxylating)